MAAALDARIIARQGQTRLSLPKDHRLVETTPMLGWEPETVAGGAAARMEIQHFSAVHAFASRCFTNPAVPDKLEASRRSILHLRFVQAFWVRILGELVDSKLTDALEDVNATTMDDYFEVYDSLQLNNPGHLAILAPDWDACDDFDTTAQAARGQRGRANYRAAVPAQPGPPILRFISLANVTLLEVPGDPAPWKVISRLSGAFGFCLTRDSRADEMSPLQIAAAPLEAAMRERYRGATEALLARNLKDFMLSCSLPGVLAARTANVDELNVQLLDAIAYQEGGSKALAVLASRMHLLEHR
jgi:hypothetical protein